MGRLDDRAKRRIVELRRAGLSFRKIKKLLELDDIRVTPQAVFLFLKRKSVEPGAAAAWDGDQPWPPPQGREAAAPQVPGARPEPPGSPAPAPVGGQDTKEGIRIVSVASLCEGSEQLGHVLPEGLTPGSGDDGSAGTPLAPGGPATPLQLPPSQRQQVTPPARSPALVVKKATVDRAVLQKEVKDASIQTALPSPGSPALAWGAPELPPARSSQALAEKLDAVQAEVQRLSRALQAVLERQCRLERQQEHQQRLQQEVLVTLQQLGSTVSTGAVPANQPRTPAGLPGPGPFKAELR